MLGWGGECDMKKQGDDCSECHARHRLSFKDKSSGHELVAREWTHLRPGKGKKTPKKQTCLTS